MPPKPAAKEGKKKKLTKAELEAERLEAEEDARKQAIIDENEANAKKLRDEEQAKKDKEQKMEVRQTNTIHHIYIYIYSYSSRTVGNKETRQDNKLR